MIKTLLIIFLCFYVFYKVSGFLFRILFNLLGNKVQQNINKQRQQQTSTTKKYKPADGNVVVEFMPKEEEKKVKNNGKDFDGGEYVDYEEVK